MKPPLQLWLRRGLHVFSYLLGAISSEVYVLWGGYPKFAVPGSVVPNPMPVESFRSTRCGAKRHQ